jgi:SAM-dependent methyltransferase
MLDRAEFITTAAEGLAGVPDESVDVVTTRSVLIYVEDKTSAFISLHRVLRAGGRLSMFEPINRLMFPEPRGRFWGYDLAPVEGLVERVQAIFTETADPAFRAAMMDFDDRDLASLAENAGFGRVHVECHIDVGEARGDAPVSIDALLDSAPNPNAPTVREALTRALTESEQVQFSSALETAFNERRRIGRMAVAYVSATKGSGI